MDKNNNNNIQFTTLMQASQPSEQSLNLQLQSNIRWDCHCQSNVFRDTEYTGVTQEGWVRY